MVQTSPSLLRRILVAAGALTIASTLPACGSDSNTPTTEHTSAPSGAGDSGATTPESFADAVVLDVRTPEEFATGHLSGAENISFNSPEFLSRVDSLDRDATYVIYCRSGNRAGQAVKKMQTLGFERVYNLGSVAQASDATGIPVTTGDTVATS
ncbi:rhodanese-like domain-containing protein [Corynebacterium sp. 13CS0277]|uniref:rhodanese-like domain-containing protein n=1 Tax=Corynebacterium sp. 13CS0277 TaxID=2071994 RepID=UPI000D03BF49|nr:rhodanese-like domain-containing protein [Corynebacterium sp. 13CS0277]PRQ12068.1 rhodanese-like domain-containing protein [Corynebacterium sp. 13CS0277]